MAGSPGTARRARSSRGIGREAVGPEGRRRSRFDNMEALGGPMFGRLHHVAYRCRDAQRTVDFYTKVVGLKYAAAIMPPENTRLSWPLNEPGKPARKVVDNASDSIHIFFELGDGSYLAFYDVASSAEEKEDPATPWWVKHIA